MLRIRISFNAESDLDPAYEVNAGPDPVPDPGFWLPKIWGKKLQLKQSNVILIKSCILLFPTSPWGTSKLQEKPSVLKREHPAHQNLTFLQFFLWLRVTCAFFAPDPHWECRYRSSRPKSIPVRFHANCGFRFATLVLSPSVVSFSGDEQHYCVIT